MEQSLYQFPRDRANVTLDLMALVCLMAVISIVSTFAEIDLLRRIESGCLLSRSKRPPTIADKASSCCCRS